MSEFGLFIATIIGGAIFLFVAEPLFRTIDHAAVRAGLWMVEPDPARRKRIIEFHQTGKPPR